MFLADVYSDYFGVNVYSMAYEWCSGKDNRWNLTIPPWCVLLCVSVCTFFCCKISTGQGTYCTLFSPLLNVKKVDKISSPLLWHHLYLTFLCPLLMAPITNRSRTASSPQCQRKKAQAALLESHRNQTELINSDLKRDAKRSPVTQTLLFYCTNFLL